MASLSTAALAAARSDGVGGAGWAFRPRCRAVAAACVRCAGFAAAAAGLRFCVGWSTETGGNGTLDWAFAGVAAEATSASRNAAPISRWVRPLSPAFRR
ncbi:hypothetical protein AB7M47_007866 [Bradyrhizobium elkanii]